MPQIFHGRDLELQHIIMNLSLDSARVAILGTGGMGKTTLATAVLHDPQMEARYSHQYFIPCHSAPTCSELVSIIADYIGVEKGAGLSKKLLMFFEHAPSTLLVLDNLETCWESVSTRSEVENFLSLLTDFPHLGLMVSVALLNRRIWCSNHS
jgi:GTPase SAR1 family protein